MKPIDPKDRNTYNLIIAYLKAGGNSKIRNVENFCAKYEIDIEKLKGFVQSDTWESMEEKMRRSGLI